MKHGPHMMVNPRTQTTIQGESSIARYLARLLKPSYDADSSIATATLIDQWVDSASQYSHGNNKERASVLKAMNAHLGKCAWLVGNDVSLADVMLWSVITQGGEANSAPSNVKKWYQKCCDVDAFRTVLSRL